jgi:predicted nucleic acid-binding protein
MTDLLFADSNILIYAMDPSEPEKRDRAAKLLAACSSQGSLVTSPQTLNECYRVLTERRRLVSSDVARDFIRTFEWTCRAPLDWNTIVKAWQVADHRSYGWWDCLHLASAIRARCAIFISEDLHSGDEIEGMVVVNPFTTDLSPFFN